MTIPFLAEMYSLEVFQRAVRDQFAKGGSLRDFLILWCTIIAFVILCRGLWRLQRRITGAVQPNDPRRLFENALKRLGLSAADKRRLRSMARDTDVEHPTALLLSPALFDRAAEVWRARHGSARAGEDREGTMLASLKGNLFPRVRSGSSVRILVS